MALRDDPAFASFEMRLAEAMGIPRWQSVLEDFNATDQSLGVPTGAGWVVSISYNYPPYAFVSVGPLTGYEIDVTREAEFVIEGSSYLRWV